MGIHMVKAVGTCCMYLGSVHMHVQEMCTRVSTVGSVCVEGGCERL